MNIPQILGAVLAAAVAGYWLGRIRPLGRLGMWARWDVWDSPGKPRRAATFTLLAVIEPVWFWGLVWRSWRARERRC